MPLSFSKKCSFFKRTTAFHCNLLNYSFSQDNKFVPTLVLFNFSDALVDASSNGQERFGDRSEMVSQLLVVLIFQLVVLRIHCCGAVLCIVCCLTTSLPLRSRGQLWHPKMSPGIVQCPLAAKLPQLGTTVLQQQGCGEGGTSVTHSEVDMVSFNSPDFGGFTAVLFHAHPCTCAGNGKTITALVNPSVGPEERNGGNLSGKKRSKDICTSEMTKEYQLQSWVTWILQASIFYHEVKREQVRGPQPCPSCFVASPNTLKALDSSAHTQSLGEAGHIHSTTIEICALSGGGCKMGLLSNSGLAVPPLKSPDLRDKCW